MLASFRPLPIVAAVAVALGLSSCAPEYPTQAPLSIQRAGESLLIASCHPATVFEVLVDERSAGLMAETVPRVTEDGLGLQVAGGEPLDLSRIAPDARFDFEPGGSISITLVTDIGPLNGDIQLGDEGLSTETWLHRGGQSTGEPCPAPDDSGSST